MCLTPDMQLVEFWQLNLHENNFDGVHAQEVEDFDDVLFLGVWVDDREPRDFDRADAIQTLLVMLNEFMRSMYSVVDL
jgi:hypothetical protein